MGALDMVLSEVESKFGLRGGNATNLLSSLLALINEQSGGLGGLLNRFKRAGFSDTVSAWLSGDAKAVGAEQVESALGRSTLDGIASKAGLSVSAAASALGFMLPKLIQKLAPGGVLPAHLPSEFTSYLTGPTAAVASGARQAMYAAERATEKTTGLARFLWPLLGLLTVLLLGLWLWNSSGSTKNVAFNAAEQVRLAAQRATAALAGLKPGFSASELVGALNLNILNFATGSAQIPTDSYGFLNSSAVAIKELPSGSVIEIGGHTDNSGDAASNLQLSQQRADTVRSYLIQQGVNPAALVAKGYGDSKPVATNDTEEGKFRNRRIEFSVLR